MYRARIAAVSLRLPVLLFVAMLGAGCEESRPSPMWQAYRAARPPLGLTPGLRLSAARIPLFSEPWSVRQSDVVAMLDVHVQAGRTDDAFDLLRAQALLQGGDAVLGVAFHHDALTGESTITGTAVRYLETEPDRTPPLLSLTNLPTVIPVIAGDSIGRPIEAIATLSAEIDASDASGGNDTIRAQADRMGADAVVNATVRQDRVGPPRVTGLAVRFRDLVGGRSYDVLDRVSVPAQGEDDPEALEQLRMRARRLGANLIVNVALQLADRPGTPDQLVGDAVHVRTMPPNN